MNFWNKNDRLLENIKKFSKKAKINVFTENLKNKVSDFYSLAQTVEEDIPVEVEEDEVPISFSPESAPAFAMQGDEFSDKLDDLIGELKDKSLKGDLKLLNTFYKYALKTDTGFASVIAFINRIINENLIDNDDEEQDEDSINDRIENILNGMFSKLKKYAIENEINWKVDSTEVKKQFDELRKMDLKEIQKGLEGADEFIENEEEEVPGGGLDLPRGGPEDNVNPGYGFGRTYVAKDWAAAYKAEADRYEDLADHTKNPQRKLKINQLIDTLRQLVTATEEQAEALKTVEFDKDPTNPRKKTIKNDQMREYYENITNNIKNLRKERVNLKSSIRNEDLNIKNNQYDKILSSTE
jgi:glucan-binding YG repeat protein